MAIPTSDIIALAALLLPRRAVAIIMPWAYPCVPLTDDLQQLLERARLTQHSTGLQSLGAEIVADLDDITTDQLRELGFRELEITRLRKEIFRQR